LYEKHERRQSCLSTSGTHYSIQQLAPHIHGSQARKNVLSRPILGIQLLYTD